MGGTESSISNNSFFATPGEADLMSIPSMDRPSMSPSINDTPTFTPPVNDSAAVTDIPTFTPPVNSGSSASDIPTFTPPVNDIPTFTPPKRPHRDFSGPACHHHPEEPAVAQCARCGSYVCEDCAEAYTVTGGEYANQVLCYDCCQAIVSENVELLKKQKGSIMTTFIITLVGMFIGLALFADSGSGVAMIFGMLWIGSFWSWIKNSVSGWWHAPGGPTIAGFVGSCIGAGIVAPIITARKIIECIVYLRRTSNSIKEDSECLQQMKDYMEYTKVISRNAGIDLDTLMRQGSELYNNSYAQTLRSQGEEAADAMLRRCTTTIAENGEIIRSFAA